MNDIQEAFSTARALIDELGEEHPKAMLAMIRAIDMADPDFIDKALAENGIQLPEATHVDDSGNKLITSVDLAKALNVTHEEITEKVEQLFPELVGNPVKSHRIQ